MQLLLLWFGLAIVAWLIALLSKRRPHRDAWPAYLFALPLAIQVAQYGAALDVGQPLLGIDLDAAHCREVDEQSIIDCGQAGDRSA